MGNYYVKHGTSRFDVNPIANTYSGGNANAPRAERAIVSWQDGYLEYLFTGRRTVDDKTLLVMADGAPNHWTEHDTALQVPYSANENPLFTSGCRYTDHYVSTITGIRSRVRSVSGVVHLDITDVLVRGNKVKYTNFFSIVVRLARTTGGGSYSEYYDSGNDRWVSDQDTWRAFSSFNHDYILDDNQHITGHTLSLDNASFVDFVPEVGRTYKIDVYITLKEQDEDGLDTIGTSVCEFAFLKVSKTYYISQRSSNSTYPFSNKWKGTPPYKGANSHYFMTNDFYDNVHTILPMFQLI